MTKKYHDESRMLFIKQTRRSVMTTKNAKNNAKTNVKTNAKTNKTNKTADKKSLTKNAVNTSKTVDTKNDTETADENPRVVCSVTYPDTKTEIHKTFLLEKIPTHAVLVRYHAPKKLGAPRSEHVLTYTKSEKLAHAHVRRIKKQYIGKTASISQRYQSDVFVVPVVATKLTEPNPEMIEDRSWERRLNAAHKLALIADLQKTADPKTA
jgi:hypothetical protein